MTSLPELRPGELREAAISIESVQESPEVSPVEPKKAGGFLVARQGEAPRNDRAGLLTGDSLRKALK
jgi:hypothetical protein